MSFLHSFLADTNCYHSDNVTVDFVLDDHYISYPFQNVNFICLYQNCKFFIKLKHNRYSVFVAILCKNGFFCMYALLLFLVFEFEYIGVSALLAYRIGRPPSYVFIHCPHSLNIFSSETTGPIKVKFHIELLWDGETKVCSNGPGHITKIATMPIYGKNLKKSSPEPKG